ncbi:hypothetical protein ACF0H5_008321 [Mactra antiquata]
MQICSRRNEHICNHCGKWFDRTYNCHRHEAICKGPNNKKGQKTLCKKCKTPMSSYYERKKHEQKCDNGVMRFACTLCKQTFVTANQLFAHERITGHNGPSGSRSDSSPSQNLPHVNEEINDKKRVKCGSCHKSFPDRSELYHHRMTTHRQTDQTLRLLQPVPWTHRAIWEGENGEINYGLKRVYEQHKHLILRPNKLQQDNIRTTFNFPLNENFSSDDLMRHVEYIYNSVQFSFKINMSFGLILQHNRSGQFRYFIPYYNQNIFNIPVLISNRQDIMLLREKLSEIDITTYMLRQRENTEWKPLCITNVVADIYRTAFALGNTPTRLPDYIKLRKTIISFETNPNSHQPYDDNLCFFRCYAYHVKRTIHIERYCKEMFYVWSKYVKDNKLKSKDVTLHTIPDIEKCFKINIHVYSLLEDDVAIIRFKSLESIVGENNKKDIMYLNLHDQHLSYIKDFSVHVYSKKFRCDMCSKLFSSNYKCNIHKQKCNAKTKINLPGGYYSLPKIIFEKLEEYGIIVEQKDRHFPWFITYDFESLLLQETDVISSQKWHTTHKPVSVSICSNVEGFETPKFILDDNTDSLLSQLISYMYEISEKVYSLSQMKWRHVLDQLNKLDEEWDNKYTNENENQQYDDKPEIFSDADDNGGDNDFDCPNDNETGEAMETNEYEPPSEKFTNAMQKENVYFSMLKRLQEKNKISVKYNKWFDNFNNDNCEETFDVVNENTISQHMESANELLDGDDDGEGVDDNDDDHGDDDDDNFAILPFRALNSSSQNSSNYENDDYGDNDMSFSHKTTSVDQHDYDDNVPYKTSILMKKALKRLRYY